MALAAPRRLSPAEKKKSRARRNELRRERYTQTREQTRPIDELEPDALDNIIMDILGRMGDENVGTVEELARREEGRGLGRRLASEGGAQEEVGQYVAERIRNSRRGIDQFPPVDDAGGTGGRRRVKPRRKLMNRVRGQYRSEEGEEFEEPTDEEYTQAREQFYPHPLLRELEQETPEDVDEVLRDFIEKAIGSVERPPEPLSPPMPGPAGPLEEFFPELQGTGGATYRSTERLPELPLPPMPGPEGRQPTVFPEINQQDLGAILSQLLAVGALKQ